MAKYLVQAKYVGEGLKGLLKEGGSSRRAILQNTLKSIGGTLESLYYCFGEYDILGVMEVPDNVTAASFALTVSATGLVTTMTTVLMSPEEMDEVAKKSPTYRGPGQ